MARPTGSPTVPADVDAVRTEEIIGALAALDDGALVALLRRRPDLAVPPPASLTALAVRAGSRPSVERVLAGLDRHVLDVAEALCALAPLSPRDVAAVAHGVGGDATAALDELSGLLLVVDGVPLESLVTALGPYPAGLGPPARALGVEPADPAALDALLARAPEASLRVLHALRDGPPVGVVGRGRAAEASRWLLEHGVLVATGDGRVALPLETALHLRGGRTHPAAQPAMPVPTARRWPAPVVAAEAARAAEEVVRLVGLLVERWAAEPVAALRTGGLGVRELGRTATALGRSAPETATVVEIAAAAGLIGEGQDREGATFLAAAPAAADWFEARLPARWATLSGAWLTSSRTPWRVGERDERGTRLAALGPGLERGGAARLRRRVVAALGELPAGLAPAPDELHALLAWQRPRATPDATAVTAVLAELALLGITGAGALGTGGAALLTGDADAVAAGLAADLPTPVEELLVQGDLTAVVPGRPAPALAELLEAATEVESRGAGLTVRFSEASVRRALDAGRSPETLVAQLAAASRTPLPQALEYLVADVGRRHGRLRAGAAASYLRTDDTAAARELLADPRLAALALREIAPTVLVSPVPAARLVHRLQEIGAAPLLESADGVVQHARRARPPAIRVVPLARPAVRVTTPDDDALAALVAQLRTERGTAPGATDPGHVVALLRDAVASGAAVGIVVVGPSGAVQRRQVRVLAVDGGRARLRDLDRDTEIVVPVHRIASVTGG